MKLNKPQSDRIKKNDLFFLIFPFVLLNILMVYFALPLEAVKASAENSTLSSIPIGTFIYMLIIINLFLCSYVVSDLLLENACNHKGNTDTTERSAMNQPSGFIVLATFIVHLMLLLITLMFIPYRFLIPLSPHIGLLITAGAALGYHLGLKYYADRYPDQQYRYSAMGLFKSVLYAITGAFTGFIGTFSIYKLMDFSFNHLWSQAFGHRLFTEHTFTTCTFYIMIFSGIIITACFVEFYRKRKAQEPTESVSE